MIEWIYALGVLVTGIVAAYRLGRGDDVELVLTGMVSLLWPLVVLGLAYRFLSLFLVDPCLLRWRAYREQLSDGEEKPLNDRITEHPIRSYRGSYPGRPEARSEAVST